MEKSWKEWMGERCTPEELIQFEEELEREFVPKAKLEQVMEKLEREKEKVRKAQAELEQVKFEAVAERLILQAGGRNVTAIKALLNLEELRQGGEEAVRRKLEEIKEQEGYLFVGLTAPVFYATGTGVGCASHQEDVLRNAFGLGR